MAKSPSRSPALSSASRRAWIVSLALLFLLALIMGPGPGIHLVNPAAEKPLTFLGLPIIWLWAVTWFAIEAAIVLVAFRWLWSRGDDES